MIVVRLAELYGAILCLQKSARTAKAKKEESLVLTKLTNITNTWRPRRANELANDDGRLIAPRSVAQQLFASLIRRSGS
jgi:hypothetical protein